MKTTTKLYQVLNHLKNKGSLTQQASVRYFNDYRLAAKVHTLKRKYGHDISCERIPFTDVNGNKSHYGKYTYHEQA
tara:strand:- start:2018 stop:2245 length:228 start_codon:yes stop_codon:yes gene_type:complete